MPIGNAQARIYLDSLSDAQRIALKQLLAALGFNVGGMGGMAGDQMVTAFAAAYDNARIQTWVGQQREAAPAPEPGKPPKAPGFPREEDELPGAEEIPGLIVDPETGEVIGREPTPKPKYPGQPTTPPGTGLPGEEEAPENFGDLLAQWQSMFMQWGFSQDDASTLTSMIDGWLRQDFNGAQIYLQLIETEVYARYFGENLERRAQGKTWLSEATILSQRAEISRITAEYGFGMDRERAGELIVGDVSLSEWERRLDGWTRAELHGPGIQQAMLEELDEVFDDEMLYDFATKPKPIWDKAYIRAQIRGMPAGIGLGIRPEEEATAILEAGLTPEQAFSNYKVIRENLPGLLKMLAIENGLVMNPDVNTEGWNTLFQAIQTNDPEELTKWAGLVSREIARHNVGGGPLMDATGALAGLRPRAQR